MIELVTQIWGEKKVPIVWVVATLVSIFWIHEWADIHYVPMEAALASDLALEQKIEDNNKKLSTKIDANRKLMTEFIDGYEINENRKAIELIKDKLFDLKQTEISNGGSAMIDERRDSLLRKLDILNEDRECLKDTGEHCT